MSEEPISGLIELLVKNPGDASVGINLEKQICILEGKKPASADISIIAGNAASNLDYLQLHYTEGRAAGLLSVLRDRYDRYIASKEKTKKTADIREPLLPQPVVRETPPENPDEAVIRITPRNNRLVHGMIYPYIDQKIADGMETPTYALAYWNDASKVGVIFGPKDNIDQEILKRNVVAALRVDGPGRIRLYKTQVTGG